MARPLREPHRGSRACASDIHWLCHAVAALGNRRDASPAYGESVLHHQTQLLAKSLLLQLVLFLLDELCEAILRTDPDYRSLSGCVSAGHRPGFVRQQFLALLPAEPLVFGAAAGRCPQFPFK